MTRRKDRPVEGPTIGPSGSYRATDEGKQVEVVPGVTAFEHIDFSFSDHDSPYDFEGRLVLDDPPSRYLLDSFTVKRRQFDEQLSARSRPVTAEGIRAVPVETVTRLVLHSYGVESTSDALDAEQVAELRQAGMRDEDALRFVAAVYLAGSLRGVAPAGAVALAFNCSAATATRWIAAAKDAGFLKVADRRRR